MTLRDAVALACSFRTARASYLLSKWPRAVRVKRSGAVLEPANGAFDVTVAPGEGVQAAVDRCPPGGCVLLLPGTHSGPLVLAADQVVHVFGRGQATLQSSSCTALTSEAVEATCDGLVIRRDEGVASGDGGTYGLWIKGGRLRLQDCHITSKSSACVWIGGAADPVLVSCRREQARAHGQTQPLPPPLYFSPARPWVEARGRLALWLVYNAGRE